MHVYENIKGVEIRLGHIETAGMTRLNVTPICLDLIMAHPLMVAECRYRTKGIRPLTANISSVEMARSSFARENYFALQTNFEAVRPRAETKFIRIPLSDTRVSR